MNVILRNSTRRMIDQSRVSVEAEALSRGCARMDIPTTSSIAISGGFYLFYPSFHLVLRRQRCATLILSPSSAANAARLLGLPTSRARAGFTRATCVHTGG
jgi:hypothetical protein